MKFVVLVVASWTALLLAAPAHAQTERAVRITFETGDFDSARGDWPVTAVNVSGDLDSGQSFTVELRDGAGGVLWSGTAAYRPPMTTIEVGSFVAVGDVEEAAIAQRRPGQTTTPTTSPTPTTAPTPTTTPTPTTSPTPTTQPPNIGEPGEPISPIDPGTPPGPGSPVVVDGVTVIPVGGQGPQDPSDPDDPSSPEGAAPAPPGSQTPAVGGDVVTRDDPQPVPQGNGFGGAGQLALSMVVAVVFVAILFRTPLPSATTTRWRK